MMEDGFQEFHRLDYKCPWPLLGASCKTRVPDPTSKPRFVIKMQFVYNA